MNETTEMMADMVKHLALMLMEQKPELTLEQALAVVFNSDTYRKVSEKQTGLYAQSPRYVFDFLEKELTTGKMS